VPIEDISQFIEELEKAGELKRVKTQVDTDLEIAEILRRTMYSNGPAILFENVKNSEMPVLGNAFGSVKRLEIGLETSDFTEIGQRIVDMTKMDIPSGFLNKIRKIGGGFHIEEKGITFFYDGPLQGGVHIETNVHPGFMTDWQQPFLILLTQALGTSVMHETVYEDRFGYTAELNAMGANIAVFSKCLGELPCRYNGQGHPHSAIISGPTPLHGIRLQVRDLRAGMAHMIAALVAEGQSIIEGIEEVDRGYADLDDRLRALGADITRAV